MFTHIDKTSYATPKTFTKGKIEKKYTLPDVPEGLAPYWVNGVDESLLESTVCVLVKADGTHNNKLPSTVTKWEVVATGIAFKKEGDIENLPLARVISLGRALKAYNKRPKHIGYVASGTINAGDLVYTMR